MSASDVKESFRRCQGGDDEYRNTRAEQGTQDEQLGVELYWAWFMVMSSGLADYKHDVANYDKTAEKINAMYPDLVSSHDGWGYTLDGSPVVDYVFVNENRAEERKNQIREAFIAEFNDPHEPLSRPFLHDEQHMGQELCQRYFMVVTSSDDELKREIRKFASSARWINRIYPGFVREHEDWPKGVEFEQYETVWDWMFKK